MLRTQKMNWFKKWSFTQKLGASAAFLLVLFGGVSGYSLLDSYEIRREIEETNYSDIPLFQTTSTIKHNNQEFIYLIEKLRHYHQTDDKLNEEEATILFHKLNKLCLEITNLADQGSKQAQYALQEERRKEGLFRLNQPSEDYQVIANLFSQFSNSHEVLAVILHESQIESHHHSAKLATTPSDLMQTLNEKARETDKTVEEIFTRLNVHMQSSLRIAMHEHQKLQLFNFVLALTAFISGTVFALSLIYQFKNSIVPVTHKAKKIAQALSHNDYEDIQEGLNEFEMAQAVTAGTEIAELSFAFNQMVANFIRSRQAQLKTERLLAEEKSFMGFTLSSISDGVLTTNKEGVIVTANVAASRLLDCNVTSLVNQNLVTLLASQTSTNWDIFHEPSADKRRKIKINSASGKTRILDISHSPIFSEEKEILGSVIVLRDMTEMVKTNKKLAWQASHDALTGLANRRKFLTCLDDLYKTNIATSTEHALLYLDLDRFKIVNDTCGHEAGDELLIQISKFISNEIRQSDLLARLGGDEFGIILENCSLNQAIAVAEKIHQAIQQFRFFWLDKQFSVGASIGVVAYLPNRDEPSIILKAADQACYMAKNQGRNQIYTVPDAGLHLTEKNEEMNWLAIIKQALKEDNFQLFQQKIVNVNNDNTQEHRHSEILIRLKTTDGKILPPGAFLPIAERYQLMGNIDRWVISHFFSSQSDFLRTLWSNTNTQNKKNCFYSLNLSSESLNDPELISFLKQQLAQHQIPPELICFEITETMAIANLHRASQIIRAIKNLGCRFALDDFGSGMSSFGYLQTLPVDFLKIDGLFIKDLCQNSMNEIIVGALQEVAQALKIKTIAEFVEEEATLQKLQEIGVDYAQGYYIGKPNPLRRMQLVTNKTKSIQCRPHTL